MSIDLLTDTIPRMVEWDQKRLKQVARKYGLDLVVAFGSQVSGRTRAASDMDVAVRFKPGRARSGSLELEVASQLDSVFPETLQLDVSFLNDASSLLLFEVATRGKPIYELKPLLFWQFQSYAARRYDDDYKFRLRREAYLQDRVKAWERKKRRSSAKS